MLKLKVNNIVQQLRFTTIVLLSFSLFDLAAIYSQIDSTMSDSRIVNYAGIVRGKTQRVVKLELLKQDTDAIINELDQVVKGLINGDQGLKLAKHDDREFQANMQKVEQAWSQLKTTLRKYRDNPNAENQELLLRESEDYFKTTNTAVAAAEAAAGKNVQKSKNLAVILFLANLIILGVIWIISRSLNSKLKKTVNLLASSSSEISATVEEQERIASQQAASVNETTTTMDELEVSFRQSSEQAKAAAIAAQQALQLTEDGTQAVKANLEGMFTLEQKVEAVTEQMLYLSEQANEIGSISHLVSDLANRTNMLALNSSVEAARAKEHGQGFAVVAGEIRKLADQSQRSAEKISGLVSEIQSAINSTVMVTEEGSKTVKTGVEIARKTEQSFTGVADAVNNVVLSNQQISLNLKQQLDGVQQIVQAMDIINQGAKETASGISQTKAGAQQLNEAALKVQQIV